MKNYQILEYEEFDFLNSRIRGKYKFVDSNSVEYTCWLGMLHRCYSKKNIFYNYYGGRGIIVCDRWLGIDGFNNFYQDMGPKINHKLSLDRINNNGNYDPSNCRWASQKEQINNNRRTKKFSINGIVKTISEWAAEVGIDPQLVRGRIKRGWIIEDALFVKKNDDQLLSGQVFFDWIVVKKVGHDYLCECVCGKESLVGKFELINGLSKRCRSCSNSISTSNRYKKEI